MQINTINSNSQQNFRGYKNIISSSIPGTQRCRTTFMSMQLDNIKHNDLEIWNTIQKRLFKKQPSDVITFTTFQMGNNNALYLNNKPMRLAGLQKSPEKEALAMKAYTLIASLTKRLMNENNPLITNKDIAWVFYEAKHNLAGIGAENPQLVQNVLLEAYKENQPPQRNSMYINETIDNIMSDYFS